MFGLRNFFFSPRKLGFHILLATGVCIIICVIILYIIDIYSRHGKEIIMPNFIGIDSQELFKKENIKKDYIFVISDYVYDKDNPTGTVLKQDPHVGEMVKKGRKVYLTIASDTPPKVIMPQLQDVSLRQAEIMLKAIGLELGAPIYKLSPYENAVLEQLYNGRVIYPGTEISSGETIILVVGKNSESLSDENDNEVNE
jgi:beta-lactam-binding protein with PASTA domain